MRDVDDPELGHQIGALHGDMPRDKSAPVMPNQCHRPCAQIINDGNDITDQFVDGIGRWLNGLCTQVEPAQIHSRHTVRRAKRLHLVPPR